MDESWVKHYGDHEGVPTVLWVLPPGALLKSQREIQRKIPWCFWQGKEESNHFEMSESSVLNKACPQQKLFYQRLNILVGKSQTPAPPREALVKFRAQGHGLTENWSHLPKPSPSITALKGLFPGAPVTQHTMLSCQQKITRQSKSSPTPKKPPSQPEETQQASEPHSDLAEMTELLDHELKTAVINTLRALTVKVDNTPKQMGNISREMEILRNNLFKKQT